MSGERRGGNSQQDVSTIEEPRLPPGVLVSYLCHAEEENVHLKLKNLIHVFPLTKFPLCDDIEGKFIPISTRRLFANGENI